MVYREIFEQDIVPVIGRINEIRIFLTSCSGNSLCRIFRSGIRISAQQSLIIHFHPRDRVHDINLICRHRCYRLITNRSIDRTFLPFLGRHYNYPVCPPGTIHRRGRSILHHTESLNIFRINTGQIQLRGLHPIQQNQRINICSRLKRSNTANVKLRIHFLLCQGTGNTSLLPTNHTGNFPSKLGGQITIGRLQHGSIHCRNGRNHTLLFLRTESNNSNLFDIFNRWIQSDVDFSLTLDWDYFILIADEGNLQHVIWFGLD